LVFGLLRLSPGDPALILAGDSATEAQLQELRQHMGLDRPITTQFGIWATQVLRGDLGVSLHSGTSVTSMISSRIGPSLALALCPCRWGPMRLGGAAAASTGPSRRCRSWAYRCRSLWPVTP